MSRNTGAYVALSAAMVFVGSTVVVGKIITASFPVFLASALRFALASLILLPMLVRASGGFPSISRKDLVILFLQAGAGNFLFSILLLYGLKLTGAAESGIITGTTPAVIGLISLLFLKEQLTWNRGAGILIATAGIVALNLFGTSSGGHGASPMLGNVLVFGAVIGEALWTILGKAVSRNVKPLTIASMTSFFGLALFTPFAVYQAARFDFLAVPLVNWIPLLYYGIGTVGAYILWYQGVSKVLASTAGVFTGILPVSAVFLSYVVLGEPLSWSQVVGMSCVLLAIVLMTRVSPIIAKEASFP